MKKWTNKKKSLKKDSKTKLQSKQLEKDNKSQSKSQCSKEKEYPIFGLKKVEEDIYRHHSTSPIILSLPQKVRIEIFKYLSYEERIVTQLVCRLFRNEIRSRVGIQTKITDTTQNGLTFLRDLKVDSIVVGIYEIPYYSPIKSIISPEKVVELIFKAPLCIQFLDAFLQRCNKIKYLTIHNAELYEKMHHQHPELTTVSCLDWRTNDSIERFPSVLTELIELKILLPNKGRTLSYESIARILKIILTPHLKRLSIVVKGSIHFFEIRSIHLSIMRFVLYNGSITHLVISTEPKRNQSKLEKKTGDFSKDEFSKRYVKKPRFKELIFTEPIVTFRMWMHLLQTQSILTTLQIVHLIAWYEIKPVIELNLCTLRSIAIHTTLGDLNEPESVLDLKAFNKRSGGCLKELYICMSSGYSQASDITNFEKLPKNIQVLGLKHCNFQYRDFIQITRCLPHLKSLGVVSKNIGSSSNSSSNGGGDITKEFEINTKCVQRLLCIRTLDELLISGFQTSSKATLKEIKLICSSINSLSNSKLPPTCLYLNQDEKTAHWTLGPQDKFSFSIRSKWAF